MKSSGLQTNVKKEDIWCKNCIHFTPYQGGYGYCKRLARAVNENWTCNYFENAHIEKSTLDSFFQEAVADE